MFTGIVSEIGTIKARRGDGSGAELTIACRLASEALQDGESVSVSGVCLTVTGTNNESFRVTASPETLRRSTLGRRVPGDAVNLERALRPSDRMGGHFVQGHVDEVGVIRRLRPLGVGRVVSIQAPPEVRPYLVDRGSVAVDGVSLTITAVDRSGFEVTLIPATLDVTTLSAVQAGDPVNLEADILSKYVARALAVDESASAPRPSDWLAEKKAR